MGISGAIINTVLISALIHTNTILILILLIPALILTNTILKILIPALIPTTN